MFSSTQSWSGRIDEWVLVVGNKLEEKVMEEKFDTLE